MSNNLENRKYVIGGISILIVLIYLVRLFALQIMSDDYKKNADSNAFLKKLQYPSRGLITDRKGKLLVYNEPAYNLMVIMNEQHGIDTLDFCRTIGITKDFYIKRMLEIKDSKKNPGYSRHTPQLFLSQIPAQEFSQIEEKLFKFRGFSVERRSIRRYAYGIGAHILGDVGEVSQNDIDKDPYYQPGDYIGKIGVESSYEEYLRGEKGMEIWLRDVHGRLKGRYQDGKFDHRPEPGKNLQLSIDADLQALGEKIMEGKIGSIVAIEPQTGEILCMVSSPSYDPRLLIGRNRGKNLKMLQRNPRKPLLNRAISGQYPPGSTFKPTQALTFMQEGIIGPGTMFACHHGLSIGRFHQACHGHASPLSLIPAIATSCNAYFSWGFYYMMGNRRKYHNIEEAFTRWKDYMVSMGYGYKLGVDMPGERRGMIPNSEYYDKHYHKRWNGVTIISDAIGQGEVNATPLQIANLAATIANRGYFVTPHIVSHIEGSRIDSLYRTRRYTMVEHRYYDYVVAGMRKAVLDGTCTSANLPGIEVCGKTGTAQNRGQDHSAFIGFAPMNNPKIAIAVYVENGGFGAHFGVPIGAVMIEQYLNGKLSPRGQAMAEEFRDKHLFYGNSER